MSTVKVQAVDLAASDDWLTVRRYRPEACPSIDLGVVVSGLRKNSFRRVQERWKTILFETGATVTDVCETGDPESITNLTEYDFARSVGYARRGSHCRRRYR